MSDETVQFVEEWGPGVHKIEWRDVDPLTVEVFYRGTELVAVRVLEGDDTVDADPRDAMLEQARRDIERLHRLVEDLNQCVTERLAERDAVRAILAALLDDPMRLDWDGCLWCGRAGDDDEPHADDCPALEPRKSELLGR